MDYSVVIPHHNSSDLLKRLIDTVPDNGRFQIVVVDDNSTTQEYNAVVALQQSRNFELYMNAGRYAGGARNTGLSHARAEWVFFADSDDYFESDFEALADKYRKSEYDLVFFNVTSRFTDTGETAYRDKHIHFIANKAQETGDMDYLRCCYTTPWGKMYRRELIQDIQFDEVIAANDMWFAVNSGLKARRVAYEPTPLYCVTVTANSITTTLDENRFESRLQVTLRINDLLRLQRKSKFQVSVLYFLGKAYQFGWKYQIHVIRECIKHHSNPFIGIKKLLHIGSVMKDRQNTSVSK